MKQKIISKNLLISYLDERHNRTIEQIMSVDNDSLMFSLKKYAEYNNMEPIFLYFMKIKNQFKKDSFLFYPKNIRSFFKFIKLLKRCKILYINIQGTKEFLIALTAKILKHDIKIIHHFHGMFFDFPKKRFIKWIFYKIYFLFVDAIITDTYTEAKKWKIFSGQKNTFAFNYGTNFKPINIKKNPKLTLLFIGRIQPDKEIERIIESIKAFKDKFVFLLIGDGNDDYLSKLKDDMKNLNYKYLGFIPHDELPRFYSQADVFINLNPIENFGRVFIESLACGTPIIGNYYATGPKRIIVNNKNGWLVKNTNDVIKILSNLNRNTINKMRPFCLKTAKKYSYEQSYKSLKKALQNL